MDTSLWPSPLGKVEETSKVNWLLFAKHVVMFVHMENESWRGKRVLSDGTYPILQRLVVMVYKPVNWPIRPSKYFVESVQRVIEEPK